MALRRAKREGSRRAGFRADRQADSRTGGFLGPVSLGRQRRSLEKKWLAFRQFGLPKVAQADTDQSIALVWREIHPLPELQGRCPSTLQSSCRARDRWIAKPYRRPRQHQSTF